MVELVGAVAEHDHGASRVDHRDEATERGPAHRLQDEVELAAELRDVRHDLVSAQLTKSGRPCRAAADQRRHVGAAQMRQLDREAANAARGAGDQHPAAEDGWSEPEDAQRGQAGGGQRCCLGEAHGNGQLGDPPWRHGDPLRPGPAVADPDDPGARSRAVFDIGLQDPGKVPAGPPTIGGGAEHPHLAAIERERAHRNQHLARRRRWLWNVSQGNPACCRAVCNQCTHST